MISTALKRDPPLTLSGLAQLEQQKGHQVSRILQRVS